MHFVHRDILWVAAATLPILGAFLAWAQWRRQTLTTQFVQPRLLPQLTVGFSPLRQKLHHILHWLAAACLFLALARPQWGFTWEETRQRGLDIIVAIDASKSMLATDVQPTRLSRAKLAALDLLRLSKSDRLGLIAFAGTAFLQCPLTLDEQAFRESVAAIEPDIMPQGGTAIAQAIQVASDAFKDTTGNYKALVLFTDGEDHDQGSLEAAANASAAGVRIFTIGVGTPAGELIRIASPEGNSDWVRDESGNPVKSRLNETILQEIASRAEGFYLPLRGAQAIETLHTRGLAPLPKGKLQSRMIQHYHERFQWPLAAAILLLLLDFLLLDLRPRGALSPRPPSTPPASSPTRAAATILLPLFLASATSFASPPEALDAYQQGRYSESYNEFKRLSDNRPKDLRLRFNAGTAAYRDGQFDQAAAEFEAAAKASHLDLQQQAYYNLGNSLFRAGESLGKPDEIQKRWEQSIANFEHALQLNNQDPDARANLDFVRRKLEELKRKQQEQQQQPGSDPDSENKDPSEQQQQGDQPKSDQNQNQDPNKPGDNAQNQQEQKPPEKSPNENPGQNSQNQQENSAPKEQPDPQSQSGNRQNQPEQEKPGQNEPGNETSQQDGSETNSTSNAAQAASGKSIQGQISPEQLKQLLDAARADEKPLIIAPKRAGGSRTRILRDW